MEMQVFKIHYQIESSKISIIVSNKLCFLNTQRKKKATDKKEGGM